jgi:tRNA(Ile)-lysidine synthase TilS/MesJ
MMQSKPTEEEKKLYAYQNSRWYCDICKLETTIGYRRKHLETAKHLKNEAKDDKIIVVDEYEQCDICGEVYNIGYKRFHLRSRVHLEMLEAMESEESIEQESSEDEDFDITRLVNRFAKKD